MREIKMPDEFIGLFFDSKMVAEVLITHKILCI